jgi:hypothetical protein
MNIRKLWHGADGEKILHILKTGNILPDSQNEIYFDESNYANCFVHGTDSKRKSSFVLAVEAELEGIHFYRAQKPGNPTTLVVKTPTPFPIKVLGMHIRSGSRSDGFNFEFVAGEEAIKLRL